MIRHVDWLGHERVARPHFAQLLVNEGKVKDQQAAFKQYLIRGKKALCSYPLDKCI